MFFLCKILNKINMLHMLCHCTYIMYVYYDYFCLGETVMGITSWGYGCGRANNPGVYTNVQFYEEWLSKTLFNSMLEF